MSRAETASRRPARRRGPGVDASRPARGGGRDGGDAERSLPEPDALRGGRSARRSILVTDGEQRSALATARSLGRAGHRVHVCSADPRPLAGASRHAVTEDAVTDPRRDLDAYVRDVRALAERLDVDVVLPLTDASLTALLPFRSEVPGLAELFPGYEAYRAVSDKARLTDAARQVGFAVPEGRVLPQAGQVPDDGELGLAYPVVVKPARSIVRVGGRLAGTPAATYAGDRPALEAAVDSMPEHAFPVLLQEKIRGEGRGLFLLRRDGSNVAVFAHRRIREKPPTGGASVCRESVPADPEMVARASRLLDRLGWRGVAMVELKRDPGSGTSHLLEVNPRFWGSLQLAVDAGVDFPRLLVASAAGSLHRPVDRYRIGVRCRWWWGEVDHLATRLRKPMEGRLPPGTPGRWRTLAELFEPSRDGDRTEVLRLSDPRPFLRETRQWLARL